MSITICSEKTVGRKEHDLECIHRKREFVPLVLRGCGNKEAAFCNWMERDVLFAQEVRRQCKKENYVSVIHDGSMDLDELADWVSNSWRHLES